MIRLVVMATLVLGMPPPELEALLERRRQAGVDRLDEVWRGVRQLVPGPASSTRASRSNLLCCSTLPRDAGLLAAMSGFTLSTVRARLPRADGGLRRPGAAGVWLPTAAVVVEILSPDDESWQKLPVYAEHHVDEVLFVDPTERTVTWLALRNGVQAGPAKPPDRARARRARRPARLPRSGGWPAVATDDLRSQDRPRGCDGLREGATQFGHLVGVCRDGFADSIRNLLACRPERHDAWKIR